jgi:hypothetical protein
MNPEFKRMIELAGLTEIAIKAPGKFIKLNLPYDSSSDTNVNIPGEEFEGAYNNLIDDLVRLNPQIDPYFFQADNDGLHEDVMDTLFHDHPEGTTLLEFYKIYFKWLFSNLITDFSKYEGEEVDQRNDIFYEYIDEFVNNAMKGRWLKIKGVTV